MNSLMDKNPKGHAGLKTLTRAHVYIITLIHVLAYDYENIKNIRNDENYDYRPTIMNI